MAADTIISADSHVFEPVNLWQSRLDRKYRERGPQFVPNYQGKPGTWFVCEGTNPRSVASIAAVGIPKEELVKFAAAHYQDLRAGGYDPAARLKDQDIDGVSAEVLYATYAMGLYLIRDAELQEAVFNAYNEWMVELVSHAPERLAGLALISAYDVEQAEKDHPSRSHHGLRDASNKRPRSCGNQGFRVRRNHSYPNGYCHVSKQSLIIHSAINAHDISVLKNF